PSFRVGSEVQVFLNDLRSLRETPENEHAELTGKPEPTPPTRAGRAHRTFTGRLNVSLLPRIRFLTHLTLLASTLVIVAAPTRRLSAAASCVACGAIAPILLVKVQSVLQARDPIRGDDFLGRFYSSSTSFLVPMVLGTVCAISSLMSWKQSHRSELLTATVVATASTVVLLELLVAGSAPSSVDPTIGWSAPVLGLAYATALTLQGRTHKQNGVQPHKATS